MRWTGCKRKRLNLHERVELGNFASQGRKISRICALFKAYSGERAWKAVGDRLQRPNCLSRVDQERKSGT